MNNSNFLKILIIITVFFSFSHAKYQQVRIGKIDKEYKNKLNRQTLRHIINDIESTFEAQLGFNVFDYSSSGKNIDIVYVPASSMEKRINRAINTLKRKEKSYKKLEKALPKKLDEIEKLSALYKDFNLDYSKSVQSYNEFIEEANSKEIKSKEEYNNLKFEARSMKKSLSLEKKELNKFEMKLRRLTNKYNNQILSLNNKIREYNRLSKELERMNRGFKKVKGRAFGIQDINIKSFYKNGKKVEQKSVKYSMSKIEIYGFESLNELRTILAHEIAHLVGIPHINAKYALMNPILQKNQIENLSLTKEDIYNFKKHF